MNQPDPDCRSPRDIATADRQMAACRDIVSALVNHAQKARADGLAEHLLFESVGLRAVSLIGALDQPAAYDFGLAIGLAANAALRLADYLTEAAQ